MLNLSAQEIQELTEAAQMSEANSRGEREVEKVPEMTPGLHTNVMIPSQSGRRLELKPMHVETFAEQEVETNAKLRLFSLYVDFEAAICARWAIGTVTKRVGLRWRISSEMWALDFFQRNQPLRGMMLQGAAEADVLIVALSSLAQREPGLIEGLETLANQTTGRPDSGVFIGLLGDEGSEARELEWTVKHFIRCAQKMNRDFIWQWMGRQAINDPAWLTDNVEKFLSRKQSLSDMAWLQEATAKVGQLPHAV